MSKNKNAIYLIILVVLAGIYLLTKFVFNTKTETNFDMSLLDVDTSKVAYFSIKPSTEKEAILFEKKNNKWIISQGGKTAEADENSIKEIYSVLASLKIENIASTDKSKWKDYKLTDSLATKLSLFDKTGNIYKELYIGKFSYRQNSMSPGVYGRNNITGLSYVRLKNNEKSFIVEGFLPMVFNRRLDDFRNRTITHFDKDSINKITFKHPADSGFVLTKTDSATWLINGKDTADFSKVDTYLKDISTLNGSRFAEANKLSSKVPVHSLTFTDNLQNTIQIQFFLAEDSSKYIVKSSQNPSALFEDLNKNFYKRFFKLDSIANTGL
jgi:hypothetical protein